MTSSIASYSENQLPPAGGASLPPPIVEFNETSDIFVQELVKHDGSEHLEPIAWNLEIDLAIQFAGALPVNDNRFPSVVRTGNTSVIADLIPNQSIREQLERTFFSAIEEQFESGMDNYFSASLQGLCTLDPFTVLDYIKMQLVANNGEVAVLAEAVRWVARQEAITLREVVVDILCSALAHLSPLVRDSSALGLAYLLEAQAIIPLRRAAEREREPELRQDLEDLIQSLDG